MSSESTIKINIEDGDTPFKTWKDALKYGLANYTKEPYKNIHTGMDIHIFRNALEKTLNDSSSNNSVSWQIHMKAFTRLPDIIKAGRPNGEPYACRQIPQNPNVKQVQRFVTDIVINGVDYFANFVVRQYSDVTNKEGKITEKGLSRFRTFTVNQQIKIEAEIEEMTLLQNARQFGTDTKCDTPLM